MLHNLTARTWKCTVIHTVEGFSFLSTCLFLKVLIPDRKLANITFVQGWKNEKNRRLKLNSSLPPRKLRIGPNLVSLLPSSFLL